MARLVQGQYSSIAETPASLKIMSVSADINDLMLLIGRYYQIRDDYEDLLSAKVNITHLILEMC